MLETASPLKQSALGSALAGTSMLRPKNGGGHRRTMIASLMLTSLVDAFSILVIFLIMNHAANNEVVNTDKVILPQARESELIQQGVVVRVEAGKFMVEDKPVALGNLVAHLKQLNSSIDVTRREGLIIVADRQMDYADLSPVILAGSSAGFTKFKFAVIRK
ncbi:MAG: ExbD/TolR family protein [Bdellovibrionales bacterium]